LKDCAGPFGWKKLTSTPPESGYVCITHASHHWPSYLELSHSFCCGFDQILNSQNLPKVLPKIWAKFGAVFRFTQLFPCPQKILLEKLYIAYYALQYLTNFLIKLIYFWQNFEFTIFAEILKIVAKFLKDSIIRVKLLCSF